TVALGSDFSATGREYHILEVKLEGDKIFGALDGDNFNDQKHQLPNGIAESFLNPTLGLRSDGQGNDFTGEIAELIAYRIELDNDQRSEVLTYLNTKYGINIPERQHDVYDHNTDNNLIGIARQDDQCLLQTNSRSVNPDNIVRISQADDLDDGEILSIGNDGGSLNPSTNVPAGFLARTGRRWRASEIGETGLVDLSFDLKGSGLLLNTPAAYGVLGDNNANFNNAYEISQKPPVVADSVLTFKQVPLINAHLFALGLREAINVSVRARLQGAYDLGSGLMRDNLRELGLIPLKEPYTNLDGFDHVGAGGGEEISQAVLNVSGDDAIVDWVMLELRDAANASQVVATRSALIQRDGDVVDVSGDGPVSFINLAPGNYYISVRHRNHLGVMTDAPVGLTQSTTVIDFSMGGAFGTHPQASLGAGGFGLWAGNANLDGQILFQGQNNESNQIFFHVLSAPGNTSFARNFIRDGYHQTDLNLDGKTIFQGSNSDPVVVFLSILSHPANMTFARNFIIFEQLP
ncbi:MAG: hypothetical protein AAF206_26135, partial [Bacteroidota bacterium]